MIALSFSRWKDSDCPWRFWKMHVAPKEERYREPENENMLIGREVAEFVRDYRKHCYRLGVSSDPKFFSQVKPSKDIAETVMDMLQAFMASEFSAVPLEARWIQVENRMSFDNQLRLITDVDEPWFDPRTAFRVIFDFAYWDGKETIYIVDEKSGWLNADVEQLRQYAFFAKIAHVQMNPQRPNDITKIVAAFNDLRRRTTRDPVEMSWPDDFRTTRQAILDKLEMVNSWTEFPAKACSQCKWCSVPGCSIRDAAQDALVEAVTDVVPSITLPQEISTKEEAEMAVQFVLFAEPVIDGVKALLSTYVDEHGPVYSGGKVAESRPNEPWKCADLMKLTQSMIAILRRKFSADGMPEHQALAAAKEATIAMLSASEREVVKTLQKYGAGQSVEMVLKGCGERKKYKPRFGLYNDSI